MKKKIVTLCLTAVLAATALIGGTMAYFTDSKEAKNTFTVGNVKIKLDEAKVEQTGEEWKADKDADRVTKNKYENVYPGAVLPKDPTVENTGKNNAYVRVKVTVSDYEAWKAIVGDNVDSIFVGTNDKKWIVDAGVKNDDNTITYTYTYKKVLEPGEVAPAVFKEVIIPATATSEQMEELQGKFNVDIVAEAIQSAGFESAKEAFDAK